jgi:hypothetical protein
VRTTIAKIFPCLPETNTKYPIIHIIAALITGGLKPTKIVKSVITIEIKINLIYGGKYLMK